MLGQIAVILTGYFLGSVPFAYLLTKLATGRDIRYVGDGNVGARNVIHVAGRVPGLLALFLDLGKGAVARWVVHRWGSGSVTLYLTGFAVVLGHCYPVWLGWRGGIGLAAATGFLSAIWPYEALVATPVFLLALLTLPHFDLAYAVFAAVFFIMALWRGNTLEGAVFIVLLWVGAGVKRIIDIPRQRAILGLEENGYSSERPSAR